MKKGRFFPEDYRVFCNGTLALCVDRFGGIESVHRIDIHEAGGKLFPERRPWKLFSRDGKVQNRPLIYPAIRFLRELPDGSVRAFYPENPDIYPSAVVSDEYSLLLGQDCFSCRLTDHIPGDSRSYLCAISKIHWFDQTEIPFSNYNQLAHEHVWLPPEFRGPDFDENQPFADGPVTLKRTFPRFEPEKNALIFSLRAESKIFRKEVLLAFTGTEKLVFSENNSQWLIRTDSTGAGTMVFACGIGSDLPSTLDRAQTALKNHDSALACHIADDRFPDMPEIAIENLPEAADFAKVFPGFQRALCLAETDDGMAIRAAFNKFGFFPIWDHIYPTRDFLIAGMPERSRKGLRYMLDYPHWDTNPFVLMHLVIALNEYIAFTNDSSLLRDFFPAFQKAFAFAMTLTDPKTGLIRYGIDTAVDVMPELGLNGLFHASCVNGWWYDCCCCLVNFALQMQDEEFAEKAINIENAIEENFIPVFYDESSGWLQAAVGEHYESMHCQVFLQNKTLAADYIHGAWLLRRIRKAMAGYLMKRLHHPWGVSAVAFDSEVPAIYLKGTRMNHHLGHSCKVLRSADRMDGVRHLLDNYLYVFGETLNAIETFNYSYCSGNQSQRADWQTFSATAAMQAIIQGRIGIGWHRGGLFYVPAEDSGKCRMDNFHFQGRRYGVTISGTGKHAALFLNERQVEGTMQLPCDLQKKNNNLRIERNNLPVDRPILLWLIDVGISNVESGPGYLRFETESGGFAKMECSVPSQSRLKINGVPAETEYDASVRRMWFSGIVKPNSKFDITMN